MRRVTARFGRFVSELLLLSRCRRAPRAVCHGRRDKGCQIQRFNGQITNGLAVAGLLAAAVRPGLGGAHPASRGALAADDVGAKSTARQVNHAQRS